VEQIVRPLTRLHRATRRSTPTDLGHASDYPRLDRENAETLEFLCRSGLDAAAEGTPVRAARRGVLVGDLSARAAAGGHIAVIGCAEVGTAPALLAAGFSVLALDPSAARCARVRVAVQALGGEAASRLRVAHLGASELARAFDDATIPCLDGVIACDGALNLEPDLGAFVDALRGLVKPGAPIVASVHGRWSPWRLAEDASRWAPIEPFRRLGFGFRPIPAGESHTLWMTHFSPREFRAYFAHGFTLEAQRGLGMALPPPVVAAPIEAHPRAISVLARVDDLLCRLGLSAWAAESCLFIWRRRAMTR